MGVKVFLDTNVLIRSNYAHLPLHSQARGLVEQQRNAKAELWISRQIIREYLSQVTRDDFLTAKPAVDEIYQILDRSLIGVKIADETDAVTQKLRELLKTYPTGGRQVHDANIVAAMLVNDVPTLITHNIEDMKRYTPLIVLVPLPTA